MIVVVVVVLPLPWTISRVTCSTLRSCSTRCSRKRIITLGVAVVVGVPLFTVIYPKSSCGESIYLESC